jgi:hypothetical protein
MFYTVHRSLLADPPQVREVLQELCFQQLVIIYKATGHSIARPEGYTPPLTSALDGVGGKCHAPAALTPGMTLYTRYRELDGPQGRSGRVRKISPPPGFDSRTPPGRSALQKIRNSKIQLLGETVIPRTEQKLRTNNLHFSFSRLMRWDSPLNDNKTMSTRQPSNGRCATQNHTKVHFRKSRSTYLGSVPNNDNDISEGVHGTLLAASNWHSGLHSAQCTYGLVRVPIEKTQNYSVQTVTRSVLPWC